LLLDQRRGRCCCEGEDFEDFGFRAFLHWKDVLKAKRNIKNKDEYRIFIECKEKAATSIKKQKLIKLSGRNIQKYLSCNGEAKQLLQEAISAAMAEQATSKTDCETLEGHPQCEKKLKEVQTTFSCSLFPDGVPGKRDRMKLWTSSLWNGHLHSAPRDKGEKAKAAKAKANVAN